MTKHKGNNLSLLSDHDLKKLLNSGLLIVEPLGKGAIGPSSIDLRLGSTFVRYLPQTIEVEQTTPQVEEIDISQGYTLQPGEFVLGMSLEKIYIGNGYQGFIETKGNMARAGIQIHSNDGHIDPGTNGHITFEIKNLHGSNVNVRLVPEVYICQLFVWSLSSPSDAVYSGKYSRQTKPTSYLPDTVRNT